MSDAKQIKADLKDLIALVPNDADENALRSVAFHVKQARHYVERVIQRIDNRTARADKKLAAESAAKKKASGAKAREAKKHEAEKQLAELDGPAPASVTVEE